MLLRKKNIFVRVYFEKNYFQLCTLDWLCNVQFKYLATKILLVENFFDLSQLGSNMQNIQNQREI